MNTVSDFGTPLLAKNTERSYDTLDPSKTILIVTEDTKGGLYYLQDMKSYLQLTVEVEAVHSQKTDPRNVVRFTIEKAGTAEESTYSPHDIDKKIIYSQYDRVYCLFDGDVWYRGGTEQKNVEQAISSAKGQLFRNKRTNKPIPLRALISTPCFEIFQLLHFGDTLPSPDEEVPSVKSLCEGVKRTLKESMREFHSENGRYDFKSVWHPGLQDACNRSRLNARKHHPFKNPSTQAHRLVAVLLHMRNIKNRQLKLNTNGM